MRCFTVLARFKLVGFLAISLPMLGCMPPVNSGADSADPGGGSSNNAGQGQPGGGSGDAGDTGTGSDSGDGVTALPFRLYSTLDGDLIEIETNPFKLRFIGDANAGPVALATAPDGTMYAVSNPLDVVSQLLTVDVATGVFTPVPSFAFRGVPDGSVHIAQADFSPDGKLYAIEYGPAPALYAVDLTSGMMTPTAVLNTTDFAFGADGRLFSRDASSRLITTDLSSGALQTTVGEAGALKLGGVLISYLSDMRWAPDGKLYALAIDTRDQTSVYQIDPVDGTTKRLATFAVVLDGFAIQ